jgi:hypothetical protein
MTHPHIEIKTTGARSEVFINGQYVPGVGNIEFKHSPLETPVLKLSFPAIDLTWDMTNVLPELPKALSFWYVPRYNSSSADES